MISIFFCKFLMFTHVLWVRFFAFVSFWRICNCVFVLLNTLDCVCCNPNLGLTIKARACKDIGQEGSLGVWESVRMDIHTPKGAPILGVGVSVDSRIFKEQLQGSKPIALRSSLYHWKPIERYMSKMVSHDPFGYPKHKLWPKERSGVKLAIWLSTTKSRESTWVLCVQVACNTSLESSQQGLQLCFRPHPDQRSTHKVIALKRCGSFDFGNFGTPIWESGDKKPFRCGPRGEA